MMPECPKCGVPATAIARSPEGPCTCAKCGPFRTELQQKWYDRYHMSSKTETPPPEEKPSWLKWVT